jgi:predicted phage replisome organizer
MPRDSGERFRSSQGRKCIFVAEVKWIKITTDMFEDDKIDFICSLPEADALIVIWIRLLTMAGKCNAGGYVFLTENIPYTEEMLAHKFRKPVNIVKLALETFRKLGMIEDIDNKIFITNFEKHQNIDALEKIKEQTRKRVAKHREKLKLERNVTATLPVTHSNAIDKDIDKDIDIYSSCCSSNSGNDWQKIQKVWDNNIHPMTSIERENLLSWLDELPVDVILLAIEEAVKSNVRTMRYIDGILINWHGNGLLTKEAVLSHMRDREDEKKKRQVKKAANTEDDEPAWMKMIDWGDEDDKGRGKQNTEAP